MNEFSQLFDALIARSDETARLKFQMADSDKTDNKLSKEEFVQYYEKHFSSYEESHFLDVVAVMLDRAEAAVILDESPAVISKRAPSIRPADQTKATPTENER
eukprot:2674739-Prymnesium_polylepis.2